MPNRQEDSTWIANAVSLWATTTAGTIKAVLANTENGALATLGYAIKDDGSANPTPLNLNTKCGGLITTSVAEASLYLGDKYTASYSAAIATDTTLTLLATTNASTKYTNLDIAVSLSCVTNVKLYELASNQAVAGTACTSYNCNRTSASTSATIVTSTPSAVTVSTTILYQWNAYGAMNINLPTFRLNASKNYYLLLTPTAAGTNTLGATLTWTEVSNRT